MMKSLGLALRMGVLGAVLATCVVGAIPASAQTSPSAPPPATTAGPGATIINPTAQAVKEAQLLEGLKAGQAITGRASLPNKDAGTLIQPGRDWRSFNRETLPTIATIAVLGMLAALAAFYLIRGRIRISKGASTMRILRFDALDRFAHWLTATSFLTLALTGANVTFGRALLHPIMGAEGFAAWAGLAKTVHNYVGFAFMVGIALMFVLWAKDNVPSLHDLKWFAAGGGLLGKGHPPARRFNGGQKIVFWSVVGGGAILSLSGWHLLFPAQEGLADAQWHATVHGALAFMLLALILAHIYIGSIGMEGAFEAMGSGEVDLNWAKDHHSIWVKEEQERKSGSRISGAVHPAE